MSRAVGEALCLDLMWHWLQGAGLNDRVKSKSYRVKGDEGASSNMGF